MQPIKALQEKIEQSELGQEWISHPLLNRDVWSVEELGYSEEESKIRGTRNIYFDKFSLPWLKLLAKLTILSELRRKSSLALVIKRVLYLRQFDEFLVTESCYQSELLNSFLIQKFINTGKAIRSKQITIAYATKLWTEEQWLELPNIPLKIKQKSPTVEIIPEEVLCQIYKNFDLFPPPLERLFRLQLVLGCRIGEMLKMPRQCLKKEGEQWFLLRWVEKRKYWRFYQIHSFVAELVREQQKFLDKKFGFNSEFDKLFCKVSAANRDSANNKKRFEGNPVYLPELLSLSTACNWLKNFSEIFDLKDKHGNEFKLSSHKFRRTKASIMAYCEAEDEYIAAILGHGSLDMLPHYRNRSLDRLEKEAQAKGYVDLYGRITTFKPRKRRYEKLAEIIETKITTQLGGCHRPLMLGDCQYRYACLPCIHHRVTEKDRPKIEADIKCLEKDLEQAQSAGQERRITEINRLLELLKARLQGLKQLENLKGESHE